MDFIATKQKKIKEKEAKENWEAKVKKEVLQKAKKAAKHGKGPYNQAKKQ